MDLNLQPLSQTCHISGKPFTEGARVASYLVDDSHSAEVLRFDLLESESAGFAPQGTVVCRWVQPYKPRKAGENHERTLKLTTENLFLTLVDPATEPTEENTRLLLFLALMLERKKILKPRGLTADGLRQRYEHSRSKQIFELPATELSPEFFVKVQEQLSVLVGVPKKKEKPPEADASAKSATSEGGEQAPSQPSAS